MKIIFHLDNTVRVSSFVYHFALAGFSSLHSFALVIQTRVTFSIVLLLHSFSFAANARQLLQLSKFSVVSWSGTVFFHSNKNAINMRPKWHSNHSTNDSNELRPHRNIFLYCFQIVFLLVFQLQLFPTFSHISRFDILGISFAYLYTCILCSFPTINCSLPQTPSFNLLLFNSFVFLHFERYGLLWTCV